MRGEDQQREMFSYGSLERVLVDHPLRAIRGMVDEALKGLSPRFDEIYDEEVRPSIRSGAAVASPAAADAVHRAQRAHALGTGWNTICCSAGSWDWE